MNAQVQEAIVWASQWVAMKCCTAINSAITPALFDATDHFLVLNSILELCENVMANSLPFEPWELFLLIQTSSKPVIETCTFDNAVAAFRDTMFVIRDQIKKWWLNKAQEITRIYTFPTVDKAFTKWLTESFQESVKELCSIFRDLDFTVVVLDRFNAQTERSQESSKEICSLLRDLDFKEAA